MLSNVNVVCKLPEEPRVDFNTKYNSPSKTMLYKTDQTLILTGEGERLKELLRTRLIECGWRDQVQMLCRDYVRKHGVYNVKVDDLIGEITPQGRALVPDSVKKELLQKIKAYLMQDVRK